MPGRIDDNEQRLAATGREVEDQRFIEKFAAQTRKIYPNMPAGREALIAAHACLKYSGRVGRSAAAKDLEEEAVRFAVSAHVRHAETGYDAILMRGIERHEARTLIRPRVEAILAVWARLEGA